LNIKKLVVAALLAAIGVNTPAAAQDTAPELPRFFETRLETHIRYLADDALQGRFTGTDGYRAAVDYVRQQFFEIGLIPSGDDGSYEARVPLQTVSLETRRSGMSVFGSRGRINFSAERSLIVFPNTVHTATNIRAEVIFVGFGVHAPRHAIDDYADIDVEGRIVVAMHGVHAAMSGEERAHHGDWDTKRQLAASRGAVGFLSVAFGDQGEISDWARTQADRPTIALDLEAGDAIDGQLAFSGLVGFEALFAMWEDTPIQPGDLSVHFATGDFPRFQLENEIRVFQRARHDPYQDANLVGILPGTDPDLANEYVVVTAHLDHIGVAADSSAENSQCAPVGDDLICNGAVDNATGVAVMLEMARILKAEGGLPRPVAFIALAAEEQGLLGSEYFTRHPSLPAGTMIANINLDMPIITYPFANIVAVGSDHSSLGATARRAGARMGLQIVPAPDPASTSFVHSDQYNFARHGIPALYLRTGPNSQDGTDTTAFDAHYHQASDQLDGDFAILIDQAARFGVLNTLIVRDVASAPDRPAWSHGNPFSNNDNASH
jgi:hypothetical protein